MSEGILPPGFDELEPFVAGWAHETSQARMEARCSSSMADIQAFYDAMTIRAEDALQHLEGYSFGEFPLNAGRLFCLVLALAQAHVAVEIHGKARAPDTPWPHGINIARGLPVLG